MCVSRYVVIKKMPVLKNGHLVEMAGAVNARLVSVRSSMKNIIYP